jgi:hypothetical protein
MSGLFRKVSRRAKISGLRGWGDGVGGDNIYLGLDAKPAFSPSAELMLVFT